MAGKHPEIPMDQIGLTNRYSSFGRMLPAGVGVAHYPSTRTCVFKGPAGTLELGDDEVREGIRSGTIEARLERECLGIGQ